MSRHNKVNPGQYTQAGRLSTDDAESKQGDRAHSDSPHADGVSGHERDVSK